MDRDENVRWHAQNNPEGWDSATWSAYSARIATDPAFRAQATRAHRARCTWVDARLSEDIGRRRVSIGYRNRLRRDLAAEALRMIPRPDPMEGRRAPEAPVDPDPLEAEDETHDSAFVGAL